MTEEDKIEFAVVNAIRNYARIFGKIRFYKNETPDELLRRVRYKRPE